jgi:hypothetical protein
MTLLQARTTKLALCVVVFFVASGFATVITVDNPSFQTLPTGVHLSAGEFTTSSQGIPGWTIAPGSSNFTGQFHPNFGTHGNFGTPAPNGGAISAYSGGGTILSDCPPRSSRRSNLHYDGLPRLEE